MIRFLCVAFICVLPGLALAQNSTHSTPYIGSYSDNTSGLKRLANDIMTAQKANDSAKAGALLNSMVIPEADKWYPANFDNGATSRVLEKYRTNEQSLPLQLANFFLTAQSEGFKDVDVVRFEKNCDDNASEQTFNTLDARLSSFPLYELRFINGSNQFKRLFAFAYIGGGFRFVLTPDFSQPPPQKAAPGESEAGAALTRVRQGGAVTAASLINRVQPAYPQIARDEHLSGTVRLHAIIDKEGKIRELRVLTGRCSLARASIDAVRQWRYRPTLLEGTPVEVDTTIDVIFVLSR
ncbi:MAG: energy transducer TonB [Acidobacteria bacterium]|nr:energy transducer TonB [Acidobacteriota bacterium]MBS1864706.1 energy transducer TonB [Acidobacteriota bacterium]